MMNLTAKNIPYHETKKAKAEKVRLQTWNQHIDAIKSHMIERGIGTEKELSSSFPVVSPFLWNNSLPEILSSAMFVPVVPSLPAYNLYNSALHCYTLNRFMRDVSISVPTRESLKVDENDKSEEEDVIIDIVGNANEKSKNNDKEDEELDIIN
ncbi:hypothetical protein CAEBREN_22198 [Caenorhabditis brenneri]|uniref:Uncharacterized protein n=1 Tax=Caenorhabditis brenneri TaxID=135651 RepID=G0MKH0_CAEBE|nr:hypothetical protein CAEBREN_22198 [Caenorhabditis brenneri]